MQEFSFIPVNKNKKPNSEVLELATGKRTWKQFQKRKPTAKELSMFYESSHIAIVTGKISGITVIDLDGTAEQDLLKQGYKLPNTPTVKTQSGGKHLYFKYNPALKTDSKINEQKNIDIRNDGGYVVAYGDGYEWIKHIHNTPLQEVPRFFIEMYESHKKGNKKSLANGGSKGAEIEQSESMQDAYSKANYINMIDFLQHHGYDVSDKYNFSCIFHDHEDNNPSARIYTNSKGQQRYICFSHPDGKYNASLIDLWADLNKITIHESIKQVLTYAGIEHKESEFIRQQIDKYHYNTMKIGNLEYVKENYPYLYKYMKRYEAELRAIMDYAESKLLNTKYSHNGEAIFYLSKYTADKVIRAEKRTVTTNTRRANIMTNFLVTLGILNKIPFDELNKDVLKQAIQQSKDNRIISFFSFNQLTDKVLSIANYRAEQLHKAKFKISSMTRVVIHSLLGEEIANKVYPNLNNIQRKFYENKFNDDYLLFSKTIIKLIQEKGYTNKKEVVQTINDGRTVRGREYIFDKIIYEVVQAYDLKYDFMKKEQKLKYNVPLKVRSRLIYKAL